MKFIFLILLSALITDPAKIAKINTLKSGAKKAFNEGKYTEAIQKYRYLIDSLKVNEDEVNMNLASAYYLAKDTANARPTYQSLTQSTNSLIRSNSLQQLGVMSNQRGNAEEALSQFKQAIKADPTNQDARYNYEMLKKKLEDQKKKDAQKNKDKDKNQEPSEFAKKLKAQADLLVAKHEYKSAFDLMSDGLKKDKTVSTYQKYIDHIKDVVEINR